MEVEINKQEVFDEVGLITSRTGQHAKNVDGISATDDEMNIMKSFWDDSLSELYDIVRRFSSLSETEFGASYTFSLPSNWNSDTSASLTKCMRQFCVNFICAKWFNVSKKDEVGYYTGLCNGLGEKIKRLLIERKKPK